MRFRILTIAAVVAATFAAAPGAKAETRTYWDYAKQQWFVGDSKSPAFRTWRIPREMVAFTGPYQPGTIVVDTAARRLFYVEEVGKAVQYAIGVGREGFQWSGTDVITQKAEWPTWKPPTEMIAREKEKGHILPEVMPGGLDNPLGARALYIGFSFYRIHGTTDPKSVGHAVSSGCIRLTNEDITDLYDRVRIGSRVVVLKDSPVLASPVGVAPAVASPVLAVKAETTTAVLVPKPRLNPLAPKMVVKAVVEVKPVVKKKVAALAAKTPPAAAVKNIPAPATVATIPAADVPVAGAPVASDRVKDDLASADPSAPPATTDPVVGHGGASQVASSEITPATH